MKAFLLAGGLGERLRPLTDRIPKCLAPINGVPLLTIWLDHCARQGVSEVLLNVSRHADAVERLLEGRTTGPRVRLIRENEPVGNAGTVLANKAFVDGEDAFFILYADTLTDASLEAVLTCHRCHAAPLTIGLFRAQEPTSAGIVELDSSGLVRRFEEKPAIPWGDLANAGIYVAGPSLFEAIPRRGEVVDFAKDVFPRLAGRMYGVLLEGYLHDIGSPAALEAGAAGWTARQAAGVAAVPLGAM